MLFTLTFNSSISEIFSMGQVIQMRVVQQGLKYTEMWIGTYIHNWIIYYIIGEKKSDVICKTFSLLRKSLTRI